MTGGGVSAQDLTYSKSLLGELAEKCHGKGGVFERAVDMGAGIGRVASFVLRRHCSRVDLVEPMKKHLKEARKKLGGRKWPGRFYEATLQDFEPHHDKIYDLVWCQWILMYITDTDIRPFLRKAKTRMLAPGGVLVVKENVADQTGSSYFDDEEGELWKPKEQPKRRTLKETELPEPMSVVRTTGHYESLFEETGFRLLSKTQQKFSEAEMPMTVWVLF
jgi:protein N-terminal methyltransferase